MPNEGGNTLLFFAIENQNDRSKTERLYYTYKPVMVGVAYNILKDKYLAEDAVHQSFIRVINNLQKIDENDCHKTKGFLVIICRNVSYDIYKQDKNMDLNFLEESENTFMDTSDQPIDLVINEENSRDLINKIKNHLLHSVAFRIPNRLILLDKSPDTVAIWDYEKPN